jgi:hypothetical protein
MADQALDKHINTFYAILVSLYFLLIAKFDKTLLIVKRKASCSKST